MTSRFRGALKGEIPVWLREGILTPEGARTLEANYQLGDLEMEGGRLLASFIFGIGGLFVGGGILAFVAAHWSALGVAFKVAMVFAGLLGFHGAGFTLWHYRGWPRLGHALIFTGCIVYGASIGLMAQIFHVYSAWQRGFGAWAAGALAVAWVVESPWIGLLAALLGSVWFNGELFNQGDLWGAFPLLLAGFVVPLALRTRSRALHFACMVAFVEAFTAIASEKGHSVFSVLSAWAAAGFLAWAWGEFVETRTRWPSLAGSARIAGVLSLAAAAYTWSFHGLWEQSLWRRPDVQDFVEAWAFPVLLPAVAGVALLAAAWLSPASGPQGRKAGWTVAAAALLLLVSGAISAGITPMDHPYRYYAPDPFPATTISPVLLSNLSAFLLAGAAVLTGLAGERRGRFWAGALFAVLLVLSRFIEYETSLLLKACAFLACGVLVIWGGILFERRMRRKGGNHV